MMFLKATNKLLATASIISVFLLFLPKTIFAKLLQEDAINNSLGEFGDVGLVSGYSNPSGTSALSIVARSVTIFISFVGIIFLILIILSGITWMTAQGDKDKIEKSKTRIKEGVIGLAIILGAYLITFAIMYYVGQSVGIATGPGDYENPWSIW